MKSAALATFAMLLGLTANAQASDYYVSVGRGNGKEASKANPAKDLGNIISKLKAGDVVHLAEGVYKGRDESGSDSVTVPIKVLGGYSDDFAKRDPWGAHQTIFTGVATLKGSTQYRLNITARTCGSAEVVVDGIIFDNGPRNRFTTPANVAILRTADMGKNLNPSPESGGLQVKLGTDCKAMIANNVVMNTAPTGGAMAIWGGERTSATIANNLIINNTGEGIFALTQFHPRDGKSMAAFNIHHNTVLFSWKHDAIATYGGNGLKLDTDIVATASNNVFGFGDYGGVDNIKINKQLTLKDNLMAGNRLYDYREFNTYINVSELQNEADQLTKQSTGNVSPAIVVPVSQRWAALYAGRVEVSRAAVDASAKASNSGANQLRSMLGLPLQASAVSTDAAVWLPLMTVAEALPAGEKPYAGGFGCSKPAAE